MRLWFWNNSRSSACRHGNEKVFELLLSLGAVTTSKNRVGATPLHLACQFKHLHMVKVIDLSVTVTYII